MNNSVNSILMNEMSEWFMIQKVGVNNNKAKYKLINYECIKCDNCAIK